MGLPLANFCVVSTEMFFSVLLFEARFQKKDGTILGKPLSVFAKQAYRVGDLTPERTSQS